MRTDPLTPPRSPLLKYAPGRNKTLTHHIFNLLSLLHLSVCEVTDYTNSRKENVGTKRKQVKEYACISTIDVAVSPRLIYNSFQNKTLAYVPTHAQLIDKTQYHYHKHSHILITEK